MDVTCPRCGSRRTSSAHRFCSTCGDSWGAESGVQPGEPLSSPTHRTAVRVALATTTVVAVIAAVCVAVLQSRESGPTEPRPGDELVITATAPGVVLTAPDGALPEGATLSVERLGRAAPAAVGSFSGFASTRTAIRVDTSSGQPAVPLQMTADLPRRGDDQPSPLSVGLIAADPGGGARLLDGEVDDAGEAVVADLPRTGLVWPITVDYPTIVELARRHLDHLATETAVEPECTADAPTIGSRRYSLTSPSVGWVCLDAEDSQLQVTVTARTSDAYRITSEQDTSASSRPSGSDDSTVGATLADAIGASAVVAPGVAGRLVRGAGAGELDFTPDASLTLVSTLLAAVESWGLRPDDVPASCLRPLLAPAGHDTLGEEDVAETTAAFFSCARSGEGLTEPDRAILDLVSASPAGFASAYRAASGSAEDAAGVSASIVDGPAVLAVPGAETGRVSFDHPTWGPVTLVTSEVSTSTSRFSSTIEGVISVFDASGRVVWDFSTDGPGSDIPFYEMRLHSPAVDDTGRIFIDWNPGRYNGVTALLPIDGGFEDDETLMDPGDYNGRFYYAEVVDPDEDGTFEVEQFENDCDPDCAGGTITSELWRWTGSGYSL